MSESIYSLSDQSESKEPQYVIAKRDVRNGCDYKRAFALVPVWEDQPKEQSHADATTVLYALNELAALRDSHEALVAALDGCYVLLSSGPQVPDDQYHVVTAAAQALLKAGEVAGK